MKTTERKLPKRERTETTTAFFALSTGLLATASDA
jgi:hypothetical protein